MSRDISKLSPYMQTAWHAFKKLCDAEKLGIFLVCTDRGREEQEAAFNSVPKRSNARYGESAHNVLLPNGKPASEAWDVGLIVDGKYEGRSEHPNYQRAGKIGESLGLKWYGNPKWNFVEAAHFQNMGWVKPNQKR
jgi:peptidoglycan LD-endopeptidase CwlK